MATPFSLRFRYSDDPDYIKEQEKLKKDTSWHKCHDFMKGYFWRRYSDNTSVYNSDLHKRNVDFLEFPSLNSEEIEKIVASIKEERKKIEEWQDAHPPDPIKLDAICFPKIKGGFPDISAESLCNVQPMTSPIKNKSC